ncbi:response regulator transcription factor [Chryseobacterium sp. LC2016-27]|uniref:LytR/AlgR family response regulator transcription factor n=1 Tax=Chryseobacterium sp. LC2016-27 TaxID=2897326 RepID=UPI001E651D6C|nr:response regulator transcription factor [Chryseobacterium sp. LC2016-27]MCD0456403.1 response regulator transcription factor [Chryseobacterium sp. LC2016-27]
MGTIYRCLIIDDETPAHKALASHLSHFDDLEHTASVYSGMEALKILNEQRFDIIFLDINMPVISGIQIMELQPNRPLTIITTAYSDFAVTAYKNNVIDYLIKPIAFDDFKNAIEKVKIYYSGYDALKRKSTNKTTSISYSKNGENIEIAINQIMYIESMGNYIKVHTTKNKVPIVIYKTLLNILNETSNTELLQIHRSYIVNKSYISSLSQNNIILLNTTELPVGRKYKILLNLPR